MTVIRLCADCIVTSIIGTCVYVCVQRSTNKEKWENPRREINRHVSGIRVTIYLYIRIDDISNSRLYIVYRKIAIVKFMTQADYVISVDRVNIRRTE